MHCFRWFKMDIFSMLIAEIAQWYSAGLRAGWSGLQVLGGAGDFCLHHRIQTGSGAHPASYPIGAKGSFPGVKRPGREADHSLQPSAEVKNAWSYTSTPQYAFMALCSVKAQGQLYLYLYVLFSWYWPAKPLGSPVTSWAEGYWSLLSRNFIDSLLSP
jgi:hypothetical protein